MEMNWEMKMILVIRVIPFPLPDDKYRGLNFLKLNENRLRMASAQNSPYSLRGILYPP